MDFLTVSPEFYLILLFKKILNPLISLLVFSPSSRHNRYQQKGLEIKTTLNNYSSTYILAPGNKASGYETEIKLGIWSESPNMHIFLMPFEASR